MNVSSIVVQAMSEHIDKLVEHFKSVEYCDYYMHDKQKGKIILVIEGQGVEEEIEKLVKIQQTPHVMAADMMMTYQETELDEEFRILQEADEVPAMLNDENVDVDQIVYHGDLRHKKLGF